MSLLRMKFTKLTNNLAFINAEKGFVETGLKLGETIEMELTNIVINRNLNRIIQTASISNLLYEAMYAYFGKYDNVEVLLDDERLFIGEIIKKSSTMSKGEYSVSFELADKLVILDRLKLPYIAQNNDTTSIALQSFVESAIHEAIKKIQYLPNDYIKVKFNTENALVGRYEATGNILKNLANIKEKYALLIYGDKNGDLVVTTPYFLRSNLNKVKVKVLDVLSYPMQITISNSLEDNNTIIVIGFNGLKEIEDSGKKQQVDKALTYGVAFDPVTFQSNGGNINYEIEYALDVTGGKPELNKIALNKLMEDLKQYKINVSNMPFSNDWEVGDLVTISNHPEVDSDRIFMVEEIIHTINKEEFKTDIVLTAFSLGVLPQDLLQGDKYTLGIFDDIVNVELGKTFRQQ